MNKVAYQNTSQEPQYVGGFLIMPGDTREVYAHDVPGYTAIGVDQSQPVARHIVDVLSDGAEGDVLAAIPSLCDDDLIDLGEREQGGAARKSVLGAISEALLTRGQDKQNPSDEQKPPVEDQEPPVEAPAPIKAKK
ncbi:hypothetical protein DTO96_102518 [Ephemeroptericola cinctiostellae]|uniref:Uncharacterized protein n=1 Tax=Ephemeroptericola cinctiostellae TaxID=2268024 RepID=A0A345DEH4_9BURK|nr:hypothetical protein [Ephemeroptericola cinctiostellae]AXF86762.1 hypothetical protein DTO96_102518 [Ephemeroptericola cinctiostellae]